MVCSSSQHVHIDTDGSIYPSKHIGSQLAFRAWVLVRACLGRNTRDVLNILWKLPTYDLLCGEYFSLTGSSFSASPPCEVASDVSFPADLGPEG